MNAIENHVHKTVRISLDRIVARVTRALRKPIHRNLQMASAMVSLCQENNVNFRC